MAKFDPLRHHQIKGNALAFGDYQLDDLLQCGYSTPLYVYCKRVVDAKIATLRDLLAPEFKIYYSIKANPFADIVAYLYACVDGFEVSSVYELQLALNTGMSGKNICYTGPGKNHEEIQAAIRAEVVISAESGAEIERIIRCGSALGVVPKVLIRVNPDFTQRRAGVNMASGCSPFGIDAECVPQMLRWLEKARLTLEGFHVYTGSQILDADAINDAQNHIHRLLGELAGGCARPVNIVNIGGGFGIPYFSKHSPLDIGLVARNLNSLRPTFDSENFSTGLSTILELGRYLVGESGVYVCRVIDKKVSRGKTYLITDGGLHHHLAASGNLGQRIRKNFPVYVANNLASQKMQVVTVTGKLCTPLDILAEDVEVSACTRGDYIAIMNSGAYGLSASPVKFLNHPVAQEVLL